MTDLVPFASGLLPYSDAERAADEARERAVTERQFRRRRAAPNGRYDRAGSAETKARDLRVMGESAQ